MFARNGASTGVGDGFILPKKAIFRKNRINRIKKCSHMLILNFSDSSMYGVLKKEICNINFSKKIKMHAIDIWSKIKVVSMNYWLWIYYLLILNLYPSCYLVLNAFIYISIKYTSLYCSLWYLNINITAVYNMDHYHNIEQHIFF